MKNVQIILDSACDMQKPEADALGVTLLPLRTNFGGEVFLDGVTMTHDEFFEKLTQAKTLPTTSQIPPFDFEEAFRRLHAEGSDILVITLSSKLSGTYQSAVIAAQETGIDVTIVDSENVTAGERVLADLAIRLRDKGCGAKEIAAKLEEAKKHLCIIGRVDTLEYLYRGGRLSKTSAIAGTLLNIKPVLTVKDGQLAVLGKARGAKQSNNFLNEAITKRGGIDFSQPLMLGYSGTSDAALQEYIAASRVICDSSFRLPPSAAPSARTSALAQSSSRFLRTNNNCNFFPFLLPPRQNNAIMQESSGQELPA